MFNFQSLGLFVILIFSSVYSNAKYFPPANVQKMIEKYEVLDDKCRGGSGDNDSTWVACDKRDKLAEQIEKKGYCWGGLNKQDPEHLYRWLPCKIIRTTH